MRGTATLSAASSPAGAGDSVPDRKSVSDALSTKNSAFRSRAQASARWGRVTPSAHVRDGRTGQDGRLEGFDGQVTQLRKVEWVVLRGQDRVDDVLKVAAKAFGQVGARDPRVQLLRGADEHNLSNAQKWAGEAVERMHGRRRAGKGAGERTAEAVTRANGRGREGSTRMGGGGGDAGEGTR